MSRALGLTLLLLAAGADLAQGATWGWLGVRIRDITEQEMDEISARHGLREGFGVLIVEVLPETPAARDGLRNGDLVVAFKGRPVVDTRTLQRLVAATPVGEGVTLTVLRGEEGRRRVIVRVGVMPRAVVAERIAAEFGFMVRASSGEREGVVGRPSNAPTVAFVLRGSPAERAGLKSGDVIVEVNGQPVPSPQNLNDILAEATLDHPLRLTIRRGEEQLPLALDPAAPQIP